MSNTEANKKYLNLDEVRVSYRAKDDSIHITSGDEDLASSAFHLTLNKNSESEQILRALLIEKGLIRTKPISLLPESVPFIMDSQKPSNEVIFGLTEEGNAIWDTNSQANVLILGNSGSLPKLSRNLFAHCLTHNSQWQFYSINLNQPKADPYYEFNKTFDSIAKTVNNADGINGGVGMINELVAEMNNRYSLMHSQKVNNYANLENPARKILFVLDEAVLFMSKLFDLSQEERNQALEQFTTLLKLGHTVGIHVVLLTQRMDVVLFPEAMRSHFAVRIAAERVDTTPSVLLLGSNVANHLPKNMKGRGLFVVNGIEKVFQTAFSTDKILTEWANENADEI